MKSVCVFLGSSHGARPAYTQAAREMGRTLARLGLTLVYGAGNIGLMGELADAALAEGGEVIGVIPRALEEKEVAHRGLTRLLVVDSMHERKALMSRYADAFVCMPGGLGTLDETFEVWTWAQLGIQAKPLGLLNVEGYFDGIREFIDHAVAEAFVKRTHADLLMIDTDIPALLDRLASAPPPPDEAKWLKP